MKKFKYKVITLFNANNITAEDIEKKIELLGIKGYELVSVIPDEVKKNNHYSITSSVKLFFKKELID